MIELNEYLLGCLNSLTNYEIIKNISILMSDLPIFFLPIFLLTYWIYFTYKESEKGKEKLLYIFYSTIIGLSVSIFIQQFVDIKRPEEYLQISGNFILEHLPTASFPSDHASVSIAFLTSLFLFGYKKVGYLFLPFAILMNLSRTIVGVHWPFDILAGIITGLFSGFITYKYITKIKLVKKLNIFIIKIMKYIKL